MNTLRIAAARKLNAISTSPARIVSEPPTPSPRKMAIGKETSKNFDDLSTASLSLTWLLCEHVFVNFLQLALVYFFIGDNKILFLSTMAILPAAVCILCATRFDAIDETTAINIISYTNLVNTWLSSAMTGGIVSPLLNRVWASLSIALTAAPTAQGHKTITINFKLAMIFFYLSSFVFSTRGFYFPQSPLDSPELVALIINITIVLQYLLRFDVMKAHSAESFFHESTMQDAKSRFIAMVSHEMRTPLTAILGWSEMLNRDLHSQSPADVRRISQTIYTSGKHLSKIINDILDYSKFERRQMSFEKVTFNLVRPFQVELIELPLDEVLRDVFESNRCLIKQGLTYRLDSKLPSKLKVVGDSFRLDQALSAVISNAAKFTERGVIEVRAEVEKTNQSDPTICQIRIEVCDTGIGMRKETQHNLFQPFTQAENSATRRFGGSGLGLAITKQIVDIFGGQIQVDSLLGIGTTITITIDFPLAKSSDALTPRQPITPKAFSMPNPFGAAVIPRRHVLLVEDNPVNQMVLSRAMTTVGCSVDVVDNGSKAVQAVDQAKYDLVFMDIQMPVMDGITATLEISRRHNKIPIIGLTANADEATHLESLKAGMRELLTKPVSIAELKMAIERYPARSPTFIQGPQVAPALAANSGGARSESEPRSGQSKA